MEEQSSQEKLDSIYDRLEDGSISVTEAMKQSNAITSEIAKGQARDAAGKQMQEVFNDIDVEVARNKFHETYPDYNEIVNSGVLQPYIDKNPLLVDETLAYFQYKADQRFEAGKAETKAETETIKEPGSVKKPLTESELEAKQMRTIETMKNRKPTRTAALSEKELFEKQMRTIDKMRGE